MDLGYRRRNRASDTAAAVMADLPKNRQHSPTGSSSSSDLSVRVEHELGAGNGGTIKEVKDSGDAVANGSSIDNSTSSSSASGQYNSISLILDSSLFFLYWACVFFVG